MGYTKEVRTPGYLVLTTDLTQHFIEPTPNKVSVNRPLYETFRNNKTNKN